MARTERMPQIKTYLPVYIPNTEGQPMMAEDLDDDGNPRGKVAKATLKAGTLVLEFEDNFPALAIQRLLSRGALMGMQFIMVEVEPEEGEAEAAPSKTPAEIAADKIENEGNK